MLCSCSAHCSCHKQLPWANSLDLGTTWPSFGQEGFDDESALRKARKPPWLQIQNTCMMFQIIPVISCDRRLIEHIFALFCTILHLTHRSHLTCDIDISQPMASMAKVLFDLSANKTDEGAALGESPWWSDLLDGPFGIRQFDGFSRVISNRFNRSSNVAFEAFEASNDWDHSDPF